MNHIVYAVIIFVSLLLSWISSHHHHLTVYETWRILAENQVHRNHRNHRKNATPPKRSIE